jgi:guanylate kinase/deoxycytidine triphosphate deaminase
MIKSPVLIITGYSGAGKDAVARALVEKGEVFARVPALTTRPNREDDPGGVYEHLDPESFQERSRSGELLVESSYRGHSYGISKGTFRAVGKTGKIPILVLTPELVAKLSDEHEELFSVFLTTDDEELDRRLSERSSGTPPTDAERQRREQDRAFASKALYLVRNQSVEETTALIQDLWNHRDMSGILPKTLIDPMIRCDLLLRNTNRDRAKGASYDLSLGDEYFYQGKILHLSDENPILLIQPYDTAIVTSHEVANIPRNVAARFDLSVSLFTQGVILSNGPQVDPGFSGPLFCLLFNTSSSPVLLKRRQHYATIEFHKLLKPTGGYSGRYEGKRLIGYLPQNATQGAISKLQQEIRDIRKGTEHFQTLLMAFLSLVLVVIALVLAVRTL